ncbi:response regulator [Phenylobacterium sp.]|jgi:CheY-like chemotaxis protein|uniref:response regulator n=1 Tax=Phenylobacterium sp. TaxID=1871053 RepID=UPI002E361F68|nr:response regulator [Phenylobacterium sp.]HEX2558920.1 response regulator [Phenylobacterium sp.]
MPRVTPAAALADLRQDAPAAEVAARGAIAFALAVCGLAALGLQAQAGSAEGAMQALLAVALIVGTGGVAANFVRLPAPPQAERASREAAPAPQPSGELEPAEDREPMAGLRILMAEDNPLNQLLVHALLNGLVDALTIVSDGVEALEALRREDFDLVLMDVNMPHLGGVAAVAAVRAGQAGRRDTPIVALTAEAQPGDAERLRAAGFDAHLAKPFRPAELLAIVAGRGGRTPAARRAAA